MYPIAELDASQARIKGIKVDPSKIETVKSFPTPQNQYDVRSFLGLSGYYRKYVKGYAKIATPLTAYKF
jgi:hypothetical protein